MLIVGLGNPGKEYELTKHNVGFLAVDYFFDELTTDKIVPFGFEKKFEAEVGKAKLYNQDFWFLKPMTYMNLSGRSVASFVRYYKIDPKTQLMVMHDDLDVPLGSVKARLGGSAGGHKGILSISESLGTEDFFRLKIGIGKPKNHSSGDFDRIRGWVLEGLDNAYLQSFDKDIISQISVRIEARLKEIKAI